jgi:hypothetical protein
MSSNIIKSVQSRQATFAGDEPVAFTIYYIGPAGATPNLTQDGSGNYSFFKTGTTLDTGIATNGIIAEASEGATIGAFADAVNASSFFQCVIRDAIRAQDTTDIKVSQYTAAAESTPGGGWDFVWDVSALKEAAVCIGPEGEPVTYGPAASRISSADNIRPRNPADATPALISVPSQDLENGEFRQPSQARITRVAGTIGGSGGTGTHTYSIYSCTQAADTLLYTSTAKTDDTAFEDTFIDNEIVSAIGARLVVVAATTGTMDAVTLQAFGHWGEPGVI